MKRALLAAVVALAACAPRARPPRTALPPMVDGLDDARRSAAEAGRLWWRIDRGKGGAAIANLDEYSEDPLIGVTLVEVVDVGHGATAIVFRLTNRRPVPLALADTKCVMIDARGNEQPILATPKGSMATGASAVVAYVFDTRGARAEPLSMRLVIPEVKTIWPVVFSSRRPPR